MITTTAIATTLIPPKATFAMSIIGFVEQQLTVGVGGGVLIYNCCKRIKNDVNTQANIDNINGVYSNNQIHSYSSQLPQSNQEIINRDPNAPRIQEL